MRLFARYASKILSDTGKGLPSPLLPGLLGLALLNPLAAAEPLTLKQALELSFRQSPALQAEAAKIRACEARHRRAGLLPNPTLRIVLEDFGGSGERRGYRLGESTILLSQLIELGGKRAKRSALASSACEVIRWDYEVRRLQVALTTHRAFIEVLAAQERVRLAQKLAELAERLASAVEDRIAAGESSLPERYRAQVELARARLERERAAHDLQAVRQNLAASLGDLEARFERVIGRLDQIFPPPPFDQLLDRLRRSPDRTRWASEVVRRQRLLSVAEAATVPDVTVGVGLRHYAENGDVAAVVRFQIPLFIFNDQTTRVEEARARLEQGEAEARAALVEIRRQLTVAYHRWRQAYRSVVRLRQEIIPNAKAAMKAIERAYRSGEVGLLDLLDAQRTLFAVRRELLDAEVQWHLWHAAVVRLVGETEQEALP